MYNGTQQGGLNREVAALHSDHIIEVPQYKVFVLRGLDVADIPTQDNFRCMIYCQFGCSVVLVT